MLSSGGPGSSGLVFKVRISLDQFVYFVTVGVGQFREPHAISRVNTHGSATA